MGRADDASRPDIASARSESVLIEHAAVTEVAAVPSPIPCGWRSKAFITRQGPLSEEWARDILVFARERPRRQRAPHRVRHRVAQDPVGQARRGVSWRRIGVSGTCATGRIFRRGLSGIEGRLKPSESRAAAVRQTTAADPLSTASDRLRMIGQPGDRALVALPAQQLQERTVRDSFVSVRCKVARSPGSIM